MSDTPIVLKIDNVSKQYRLGAIGGGTLQGDIQSWWARKRGKEDPNLKIGEGEHIKNERFWALKDVSLEVHQGDTLGIIGHNGAGKSTLLKLLSRVTAPTEGEISIKGRIASMLEVGTGFHPELTGRENIYLNGAILGMSRAEINSKIEQIIEFSECSQFIDTPVKRYSSGMYVKLAFSVAAHLDSEILVMDEVLAVGDMKFQQKCLGKMGDVADKEGRTVLYVSHNMNTIRQLCNRCIVMDHGTVKYDGNVEEAIDIYMSRHFTDEKVRTYTENDYAKWCPSFFEINKAEILNKEKIININERLQFQISYSAKNDINNFFIRFVILSSKDEIVGMSMSHAPLSCHKAQEGTWNISFDTKGLAAGNYYMRFSVFEINEFGNHEYRCVMNNFFSFTLEDKPELHHAVNWNRSSWGNIAFDDLIVEDNH